MENKSRFTIVDYPERGKNSGLYTGKNATSVANKVFNKLAKDMNFMDNLGGTKYLVFYIKNLDNNKIYPYIGTIVVLQNPIEVNYDDKKIKINHRNIVTKYDKNMREVFVRKN